MSKLKLLSVMMLFFLFAEYIDAKEIEHAKMHLSDSTLTMSQKMDGVKRWVVSNEDTYGLRVVYDNPTQGTMIIKGQYRDRNNSLICVREDFIRPIASFVIEISCSNANISAEMTEASYEYITVGYGDYSSLSSYFLKCCIQEMEEIQKIISRHGDKVNCYDLYFEEMAEHYDTKVSEAEKIEQDDTLSKKERKKAKKYLEDNQRRGWPYRYVNSMPTHTVLDLFYGNKGLKKYISIEY